MWPCLKWAVWKKLWNQRGQPRNGCDGIRRLMAKFFLVSATFQTYCPTLTSLAGCRTLTPTVAGFAWPKSNTFLQPCKKWLWLYRLMAKLLITTIQVNFVLIPRGMRQYKLTWIVINFLIYLFIYLLFIKALQHKCWRSVGQQETAVSDASDSHFKVIVLIELLAGFCVGLFLYNYDLPVELVWQLLDLPDLFLRPCLGSPFDFTINFFTLAILNKTTPFFTVGLFLSKLNYLNVVLSTAVWSLS